MNKMQTQAQHQGIEQNRIDEALTLIKGIGEITPEPKFMPTKGERFVGKAQALVCRAKLHEAIMHAHGYSLTSLDAEDRVLIGQWLDKEQASIDKAAKEMRRQAYSPRH